MILVIASNKESGIEICEMLIGAKRKGRFILYPSSDYSAAKQAISLSGNPKAVVENLDSFKVGIISGVFIGSVVCASALIAFLISINMNEDRIEMEAEEAMYPYSTSLSYLYELEKEDINKESIDYVIAWYRKYKKTISKEMPIETPGVTFRAEWISRLESVVDLWETNKIPFFLARCYIYYPLFNIRKELTQLRNSQKT